MRARACGSNPARRALAIGAQVRSTTKREARLWTPAATVASASRAPRQDSPSSHIFATCLASYLAVGERFPHKPDMAASASSRLFEGECSITSARTNRGYLDNTSGLYTGIIHQG
eukprot:1939937-Pyramimonas_sp.AAC.2